MKRAGSISGLTAAALAGTLPFAPVAAAGEIYRWVDDDGSVHYSDNPPPDGETDVTTLEVPQFSSDYDPTEDPYSILNQAARTHEKWQTIEAARRERAAAQPAAVTVNYAAPQSDYGYFDYAYLYSSAFPGNPGRNPSRIARQQYRALDTLELTGPRPYSINSTAHRARVERSQFLPLVPAVPPRPVQPLPGNR